MQNLLLNTFQNTQKLKINEIKYHKTYLETHAPGLISVRLVNDNKGQLMSISSFYIPCQ